MIIPPMKTTAAILYKASQPLEIKDIEIPELKEGQVLVKIKYSGLCRSQIDEIQGLKGNVPYMPHLLGHEGSGIVEKIGTNVKKVSKGDHVVLSWIRGDGLNVQSCQYLEGAQKINSGAITTFSNHAVISENRLIKIPKNIPFDIAALLGCAVPTGAGIIKNEISPSKESSIAIFGVGGVGASALLFAQSIGCSKIIAVDITDQKLNIAKDLGATHIVNALKDTPSEKIKEITDGGVDYSVDSSGAKAAMEEAFKSTNNSGTTIIAGNLFGAKMSLDPFELIRGKTLRGTWGGGSVIEKDIPKYIDAYLKGDLKLKKLITKEYPLDQINQAIDDLKKGKLTRGLIKLQ